MGPKAKPQSEAEAETKSGARLALGAFLEAGTETAWGLGSAATGPWEGTLVTGLGYWERTLALPPPVASR